MKSISAVLLVLAAVGALAKPEPSAAYQSNGFNCYSGGYGPSVPVLNARLQTSTVENPTVSFPGFISPSTVSEACHCLQTLVRPQLRNDIITVPTVDRITRTVAGAPLVETVNCGGTTRLTTFGLPSSLQSRTLGLSEGGRGSSQGSSGMASSALYSGGTTGTIGHNSNSLGGAAANRATATLIATPTSVFALHTPHAGGGVPGCQNAYSNTGRINTF